MNDAERQRQISEMTDFRYQIVAELANPYLSAAERRRSLLSRDIRNARKEFQEGLAKPANPDDILSEILS